MQLKATVKRVIDGDTVDVLVELPLEVYKLERLRLLGINAPEMSTPQGVVSKQALVDVLGSKSVLLIMKDSSMRDKYGRLLAYITCEGIDINKMMLDKGLAVKYET